MKHLRAVVGLLLGGLVSACIRPAAPDVVLVVIDTLRADHVSSYGYSLPTTPHLDALAARSDRYTQCRSTAPWTVPSHASMFTGLFPFEHGCDAYRKEDKIIDTRPLDPSQCTLAEALKEAGYRTGGFAANTIYLSEKFGFAQGFDTYRAERLRGRVIMAKALEWLDSSAEAPSFLFVNLLDCHRPYNVEPLPDGASARLPPPSSEPPGELLERLTSAAMGGTEPVTEALAEAVRGQYDHGVAQADSALGLLLSHLESRGRLDSTLLIVTSDHGEYFGEHGLVEHSKDVYEEGVHVPLVVKAPGQSQGAVQVQPISLVALPELVFEHLPGRLQVHGRGFPRARGPWAEIRYSRPHDLQQWGQRFRRERTAVYADRFKLILTTPGQRELYDLLADPGESTNLAERHVELADRLERKGRAVVASGRATVEAPTEVQLTPEELEELRRLGYL
jgi:arylsulfatase A-like enzyme